MTPKWLGIWSLRRLHISWCRSVAAQLGEGSEAALQQRFKPLSDIKHMILSYWFQWDPTSVEVKVCPSLKREFLNLEMGIVY